MCLVGDIRRGIVEQRHEDSRRSRIVDLPQGGSGIAPRRPRGVRGVGGQVEQRRLARRRRRRPCAGGERDGRRARECADRDRRGADATSVAASSLLMAPSAPTPRRGRCVGIGEQAPNLRRPLARDLAAHLRQRRERAPAPSATRDTAAAA